MTKEVLDNLKRVLKEKYLFDELDIVEFVLYYEHVAKERIPDEWFCTDINKKDGEEPIHTEA